MPSNAKQVASRHYLSSSNLDWASPACNEGSFYSLSHYTWIAQVVGTHVNKETMYIETYQNLHVYQALV